MYTVMRERIRQAEERNRRNMPLMVARFRQRLEDEAKGIPMRAIRRDDIYEMREDGSLRRVFKATC